MGDIAGIDDVERSDRWTRVLPTLFVVAGGVLLLVGVGQAIVALRVERSVPLAVLDAVFVGGPGAVFVCVGYWLPDSGIDGRHYPRIVAWVLVGVGTMFGFVVLRDLHPGVTADWSSGTQAIALTIGSVGGLLIGIQETRVAIRTALLEERTQELEDRTRELEERERDLERQNEQLERFASVISHDLRNPLNVAQGRLALLRDDYEIDDHVDAIAGAHDRMDALIDDVLTLARQGERIGDVDPVDVAVLCRECWDAVETADATLSVGSVRPVVADDDRLRQLFENLFRNAIQHGGDAPTVTVEGLPEGFAVADDGPGIPPDERDAVFESGHTTSPDGTGFGLAIVAEIAEAHGWDVRVTESADGGARFEIAGVEFADGDDGRPEPPLGDG